MSVGATVDPKLLRILRCPVTGQELRSTTEGLVTIDGSHRYPVVSGIPCMLPETVQTTHSGFDQILQDNRRYTTGEKTFRDEDVDGFVAAMIVATGGNLFRGADLKGEYPIGQFPANFPSGTVLEIGCNWGRWTIGGGLSGRQMIGTDIHLASLLCAQRLSRRLAPRCEPLFVLGDGRSLPFRNGSFSGTFSYSVLQHFSTQNMVLVLREIKRLLQQDGQSLIQMPNRQGIRNFQHWAQRGFKPGAGFDVRYYSIAELLNLFDQNIGPTEWSVDCFLGLNVHSEEKRFMTPSRRWVVNVAERLRQASDAWPLLRRFADSVFLRSTKRD